MFIYDMFKFVMCSIQALPAGWNSSVLCWNGWYLQHVIHNSLNLALSIEYGLSITGSFISICHFRKSHISVTGKSSRIKLFCRKGNKFVAVVVSPDHCYITIKVSVFCEKCLFHRFASKHPSSKFECHFCMLHWSGGCCGNSIKNLRWNKSMSCFNQIPKRKTFSPFQ